MFAKIDFCQEGIDHLLCFESKFCEGFHNAMGRKIQLLNRFADLSLEINHIDSPNLFWQKLVFTLSIGDHFFLNLDSGGDQCCGSGTFIPDLLSWLLFILVPGSRIPGSTTATKEEVEENVLSTFFSSIKFYKFVNYIFKTGKENFFKAKSIKIILLFTPKIVTKLTKKWVCDTKSEILDLRSGSEKKNLFRIPDSRSRGQKGTGSRLRNTGSDNKYGAESHTCVNCTC